MTFTLKQTTLLTGIIGASILMSACSTTPLVCDHHFATAQQIKAVHAAPAPKPIHITKPKELVKLPILTEAPSAMTLSSHSAQVQAGSQNTYSLVMHTGEVNDVLAIQRHVPDHYAVSITGSALRAFWQQANPYFVHQYQFAVLTASHMPSQILKVNSIHFDGNTITYQVVSKNSLPVNHLSDITLTLEK